jgi:hypothetical protein
VARRRFLNSKKAATALLRSGPGDEQITANFRSRPAILTHINRCFEAPLSGKGQPGYVALAPTIDPPDHDLPCAAKITIEMPPNPRPSQIRDAEAEAVADLCARLIGNVNIRNENGDLAPLAPGGIALLAPTGPSSGATSARWRRVAFRSPPRPERACSGAKRSRTSSRSRARWPAPGIPWRLAPCSEVRWSA